MIKMIYLLLLVSLSLQAFTQATWTQSSIPGSGRFDDIYFIDSKIGYTGQSKKIFKSTDQGRKWTLVATHTSLDYIRSIEFLDENLGFFGTLGFGSVAGGLFITKDGGVTVKRINSLPPNQGVCGLAHFGDRVVAVGTFAEASTFYISDDRGETFDTVNMAQYLGGMVDVHMLSKDIIYISGTSTAATGSTPAILKSLDGGLTWTQILKVQTMAPGYIWKMAFNHKDEIIATPEILSMGTISHGRIFISYDAGDTWIEKKVNQNNCNLGGTFWLKDKYAITCDQHFNVCYESTDGGENWVDNLLIGSAINRIWAFDDGNLVAAGTGIYRYSEDASTDVSDPMIDPIEKLFSLSIHPNPAGEHINVTIDALVDSYGVLEIYNQEGRLCYKGNALQINAGASQSTIHTTLPRGSYTLLLKTNHNFVKTSFIKS